MGGSHYRSAIVSSILCNSIGYFLHNNCIGTWSENSAVYTILVFMLLLLLLHLVFVFVACCCCCYCAIQYSVCVSVYGDRCTCMYVSLCLWWVHYLLADKLICMHACEWNWLCNLVYLCNRLWPWSNYKEETALGIIFQICCCPLWTNPWTLTFQLYMLDVVHACCACMMACWHGIVCWHMYTMHVSTHFSCVCLGMLPCVHAWWHACRHNADICIHGDILCL